MRFKGIHAPAAHGLILRLVGGLTLVLFCLPPPGPLPTAHAAPPPGPLRASANGHYLVDQNNTPYLIVGDSCWAIPYNISTADAGTYLAQRQAQGFNTVYFTVLDNTYGNGRSDYSTYDGILPFTTPGDLSTPNPTYFARLDTDIQLAATHNMEVILIPIDAGNGNLGSLPLLRSNGVTKAYNFGVWLGNRYKTATNVLWASGVDFQTWQTQSDDQLVQAVAKGIASVAPAQMQTVELNFDHSSSTDDPTWSPPVSFSWVYDQWPQYDYMYREYNRTVPATSTTKMPYYLGEGDYEGENNTGRDPSTPLVLRKQAYWSALGGTTGQMFGNHYTWGFFPGWQTNVTTTGAAQFITMSKLIAQYPWWTFVPDQTHTVMTTGYGTYASTGTQSITQNDYAPTVRTPDGALAIAYLPTIRPVTIDLTKLAGPVMAQWFDPTTGTSTPIAGSPMPNVGPHVFTPPGNNRGGDADWVLILQASSATPTPTTTPGPTNTPIPPTSTPVPPTATRVPTPTATAAPPTPSATGTPTPTATATALPATPVPTATLTPTATPTSTSSTYCIPGDTSYCAPPMHRWALSEGSGQIAHDSGTNPTSGILAGGPQWTAGKNGSALSFNGNHQDVSIGNAHMNGLTKFTFEAWFKRQTPGAMVSAGEEILPADDAAIQAYSDGIVYANIGDGTTVDYGGFASNDTNWHHIAFVFDGTQSGNVNRLRGYLDGVQQSLNFYGTTVPSSATTKDTSFALGSLGTSDYTNGFIEDVRIYNYARTAAQISKDMSG